jgi:hypothetical protein
MRTTIHGVDVHEMYNDMISEEIAALSKFGCEALSMAQVRLCQMGFCEAEIVKSIYGFSVRYASGLNDFGLLYSSRGGQLDGTLQDAIDKAGEWQRAFSTRRFVTCASDYLSRAVA